MRQHYGRRSFMLRHIISNAKKSLSPLFPVLKRMCSSNARRPQSRQVLPDSVVPRHYRVRLEPDLKEYTYQGDVSIDVDVKRATNQVSVNILDCEVLSAFLDGAAALKTERNEDAQSITWTFPSELKEGSRATLDIKFNGTLNDKLSGFYRSVYKDSNGETQVVATTQMEPTDCRRAFPCFDEPSLKATFDITLVADKKYTVLSNSDVKKTTELGNGKIVTEFNTTPKMSTYLVAFIVGDLEYVENNDFRVPVRVYATPGYKDRCVFSAALAAKTLEFFEDKFGVRYPLPKCDLVGVHDFSAGAMENWGLITFRLVDIFFTEGKDSVATQTRVAEVVQHELAHQWFGNLVTMEWWDGLWLNEGFATWMSWYSTNHFYPKWKVWETYVSESYQRCLDLDGLRSSHPIQVPVERADDVFQIFDAISYLKGSCVIKMISEYLGEDVFIRGIAKYLSRHQYGNTTTDDLWRALSEVSGKDVKALMDTWTLEMGYPVLSVEELSAKRIRIVQNRYLQTADVTEADDKTLYPIWLGVRTGDGTVDRTTLLTERSRELNVDEFYKLNADQSGIFRVKYPLSRIEKLAAEGAKQDSRLSTEDRIGLVSDVGALAGGYTKTSQLLTLVKAWRDEGEVNVWRAIVAELNSVVATWRYESEEEKEALRRFRESIVVPKAKALGHEFLPTDTKQQKELKALLFSASVAVRNPEIVQTALDIYARGIERVDANIRPAVFRAVATSGTEAQWHELFQHYIEGTHGVSCNDALRMLGFSGDAALKLKVLDSILDGTVRTQDSYLAISGVCATREGQLLAWDWLRREWQRLDVIFPRALGLLSRIIGSTCSGFTKAAQLKEVTDYFDSVDQRGIDKQVEISKDRIRAAIAWLAHDKADVREWLKKAGFLEEGAAP